MRLREGVVRSPRPEMEGAGIFHPLCDDLAANAPDGPAVVAEPELSNKFAAVVDPGSSALAGAVELQDWALAEKGDRMDSKPSGSIDATAWGYPPAGIQAGAVGVDRYVNSSYLLP